MSVVNWKQVVSRNPVLGVVGQNPHQLARYVLTSGSWKLICEEEFLWRLTSIFSPINCPDTEMAANLVLDVLNTASACASLNNSFVYENGEFRLDVTGIRDVPNNYPYRKLFNEISRLESGVPVGIKNCPILQNLIESLMPKISGASEAAANAIAEERSEQLVVGYSR